MTYSPPTRPLPPVLARMALGLLLAGLGSVLTWRGVTPVPTPGLLGVTTPLSLPLDGPLPRDLAGAAALRLEGDRVEIDLGALPAGSPEVLGGRAVHRDRNPVTVQAERRGRQLSASLALRVQPLQGQPFDRGRVVVGGPEPLQHRLSLALTRRIPLTLSTQTTSGAQTLNLRPLRLRALTVRTTSGSQAVTLPGRAGGPFSLISSSGDIAVTASPGASPEALRVNTQSGDLALNLAGARMQALGVGSGSGDVRLTLPGVHQRGSVTTASGDVTVTAPPGTLGGTLDIRTQSGDVTLRVPPALRVRVRFTDRDTLTLPPGTPPATAPQLDVFVDSSSGDFALQILRGEPVPGAPPPDAPAAAPSSSRP